VTPSPSTPPTPGTWPQTDGAAVTCTEKVRVLEENLDELRQVLLDTFDDAILMGVDEAHMRALLAALVRDLRSPRA